MTGKTHRRISYLASTYIIAMHPELSLIEMGTFFIGCLYGSTWPDIDIENSFASNKYILSRFLYKIYSKISKNVIHRGFTHSIYILLLLLLINNYFCLQNETALTINFSISFITKILSSLIYGIMLGFTTHVIADMFSGGVYLFDPIIHIKIKIAHIKTGGIIESAIRYICTTGILFIIINSIFII